MPYKPTVNELSPVMDRNRENLQRERKDEGSEKSQVEKRSKHRRAEVEGKSDAPHNDESQEGWVSGLCSTHWWDVGWWPRTCTVG